MPSRYRCASPYENNRSEERRVGKECRTWRRHPRWPRDWSSDVCSSDLQRLRGLHRAAETVGLVILLTPLVAVEPHEAVAAIVTGLGRLWAVHRQLRVIDAQPVSMRIAIREQQIGRASCRERV